MWTQTYARGNKCYDTSNLKILNIISTHNFPFSCNYLLICLHHLHFLINPPRLHLVFFFEIFIPYFFSAFQLLFYVPTAFNFDNIVHVSAGGNAFFGSFFTCSSIARDVPFMEL